MTLRILGMLGLAVAASGCAAGAPADFAFVNAAWFDGAAFETRTVYVRDGVFVADADEAAQTVDLRGGYATPPLCEAHNHNLGGGDEPEVWVRRYLEGGVFYVGVMSNLPRLTDDVRPLFNRPDSVDVRFANGPFTGPRGHPIPLRERLLAQGAYPGFTVETLADHAYFEVASEAEMDRAWDIAMRDNPDFIKVMLFGANAHAERLNDPRYDGHRGLDPDLLPGLVERAHAADLRVAVHIETGSDFRVAVEAGADVIAHMPGYARAAPLDVEDAALAAEAGVVVITTASYALNFARQPERFDAVYAQQQENLRVLKDAGVQLALGSDRYTDTGHGEAAYLRDLQVLTDAEILDIWTRGCAQSVLPDRSVGRIASGFEASFVVFADDPLADWSATQTISYRFKDGAPLELD